MSEAPRVGRRRVVIIGGGFGGLVAAQKLRKADVDVTLVDRANHQAFQPLLYQCATGTVADGECALPIRVALRRSKNTRVLMAEVTDIDVKRQQLLLDRGERLDYDSLIVACGAETTYFGSDEWREVTFGLKTIDDAVALRNRFYGALEEAERANDDAECQEWMTFVVIGGGPTGVEVAGAMSIITHAKMKREYRNIDVSKVRIILVDAGQRPVAAFSEKLSAKVTEQLESIGVTIREGARATSIDARGVTLEAEGKSEHVAARTVIWAAGVRAVPFVQKLAKATGAEADRAGRVQIDPDLSVPGHPEISAIGDATLLLDPDGKPYPGLATVAIQQAGHVALGIRRGAPGATTPWKYLDKGALAVVGKGKAVCEFRGHKISGLLAFLMYLGVHLYYLGGAAGHRLRIVIDWISAFRGYRENQVIEGRLPGQKDAAPARRLRTAAEPPRERAEVSH